MIPGKTIEGNRDLKIIHLGTLAEPLAQTNFSFGCCHAVFFRAIFVFITDLGAPFLFRLVIDEIYNFVNSDLPSTNCEIF